MTKLVVYDLSNIAYICAYKRRTDIEIATSPERIIFEQCVAYMKQLYRRFQPDRVICACDSPNYWRTSIFPEYKANRKQDQLKLNVRAAIKHFKTEFSHLCVEVEGCEADDIICASTLSTDAKITIVSTDRDFEQLMSANVSLFDPMRAEFRTNVKNPALALFIKCMRGDKSDNIPSAYPYVSKKRLESAFKSEKSLGLLMATARDDGKTVFDHYERNRRLIDLSCLPQKLKTQLKTTLEAYFVVNDEGANLVSERS